MDALAAAFLNSLRGFRAAALTERAVRQELVVLVMAAPAAALIARNAWIFGLLLGALLLLLAVETLNTAIEKLCDHVTPHHHPTIGVVKDLGSAAVLFALLLAMLVWGVAIAEYLLGG